MVYHTIGGRRSWRLCPFIKNEDHKINYQHNTCNNIKYSIVHNRLSFSPLYPEENEQSQYSSQYIKVQKTHRFYDILDNLVAILRNKTVVAIPIKNVSHGILPEAPGTNTPTTSDANIIFAPSRKKLDIILKSSLGDIQCKCIIGECFVK